jgi:hypothetical protein
MLGPGDSQLLQHSSSSCLPVWLCKCSRKCPACKQRSAEQRHQSHMQFIQLMAAEQQWPAGRSVKLRVGMALACCSGPSDVVASMRRPDTSSYIGAAQQGNCGRCSRQHSISTPLQVCHMCVPGFLSSWPTVALVCGAAALLGVGSCPYC